MNILDEREKTHGDFEDVSRVAQALKECLRREDGSYDSDVYKLPCVHSEALDLICTKMARVVCGDHNEIDHWRDIIGYATLVMNDITKKVVPSGESTKGTPDEKDPSIGDDWDYNPHYRPRAGISR